MIHVSPFKRLAFAAVLASPVLAYYPIRAALLDNSNAVRPNEKLTKLIDQVAKDQKLNIQNVQLLVKDELDFKHYPNWIGSSILVIPKYLSFDSLDDLSPGYINGLLKRDYGLELKEREKWYTDEGKTIISSFLLTDQAKKFLLARNFYSILNENFFVYYSILLSAIYVPFQLVKWQRDLLMRIRNEIKLKKPKFVGDLKWGEAKMLFLRRKNTILAVTIVAFLHFCAVLYYAAGLKSSRDCDALTLSRGLSNSSQIKSKASLIDYHYYAGGEEAYRKMTEMRMALNKLFFSDMNSDLIRFFKRIPLSESGDDLEPLNNRVSVRSALDNINDWKRNSGVD